MSALDECLICGRTDHTCSRCGQPTSHVWPIHQECLRPGEAPVYVGTARWPGPTQDGDHLAHIRPGDSHRGLSQPPGGPLDACGALHPVESEVSCTRDVHPPWWQHIDATSGGKALHVWTEVERAPSWLPVPGLRRGGQ